MSKNISEASVKRSATATVARPSWRTAKASPSSVATWAWLDRLAAGGVGGGEQRRAGLAPALRVAAGGEHRAVGVEDRAAAQVRRHLGQTGDGGLGCRAARERARALTLAISANISTVSLARASWLTVVVVCAIAAVLLALSGYTGYRSSLGAVGLAAAVNLL